MVGRYEVRNGLSVNGEFDVQNSVLGECGGKAHVIDIGANIGDWTANLLENVLPSSPQTESCEVLLIDPSPHAAAILRQRFHEQTNCVVVQTAVGPQESNLTMVADGASPLNRILSTRNDPQRLAGEAHSSPDEPTIMVTTRQLTKVVEEVWSPEVVVDLVKIDAEGMDFAILQGAHELLSANRIRVVQFEYNHRWLDWGYSLQDSFAMARQLNLEIMKVTPRGLIQFKTWHPELDRFFDANFVLVNPRLIQLPALLTGEFTSRNVLRVH